MINPHFMTVPASREKEMARIMMEIQTRYTKYYVKTSEMQNTIYVAGQKAIERSVQEVMQAAQRGNEAISFDAFYNAWVGAMEEEIINLFGGDTYSKLQGDLLKIGLEIKANMDTLMEQILAPLPLVPRSEIDEINSTIYELKNKVRNLEQQLNENQKGEDLQ
jgi:BMFP domain-containing protein YqiC